MTSVIHTAVGELQRTAIDALRGLGFPFALADRVTHSLTWAEVVHGCGLRTIRLNEQRIRDAIPRSFGYFEHTIGALPFVVLDAAGKSLFESAPRAFDLADAGARKHGIGLVLVRRTFGVALLGEFVMRSTERGLGILVLFQPGGTAPVESSGDQCTAMLGLPDGVMKAAAAVLTEPGHAANMLTDFAPLVSEITGSTPDVLSALDGTEAESMHSDFLIVSFRPKDMRQSDHLAAAFDRCAASAGRWQSADDFMDRWRHAVDKGFTVDPVDWKFLYSLVAQTRVVTSERSQAQAG